MKLCKKCGEEKPITEFSFDKRNKDGRQSRCKKCINLWRADRYKTDVSFREDIKSKASLWYQENKDHKKEYDKIRVQKKWDHISKVNATWRENNLEKYKAYKKKYYEENKIDFFVRAAKRRATKNRATPSWANTEKIKQIYIDCKLISEMTGITHQVDHIVPLKGQSVSGLHVEGNLCIIPANLNLAKYNKFNEELVSGFNH